LNIKGEDMELIELLEQTKEHRFFSDTLRTNIVDYFHGKIDFDSIGLSDKTMCGRWYLSPYIDALNNLEELKFDNDTLKRIFEIYFYLSGKSDIANAVSRVNFKDIIKIFPEFYRDMIKKETLMFEIFKEEGRWDIDGGLEALEGLFGSDDTVDFIKNHKFLKSGGYYRYSQNIMCVYLWHCIKWNYERENYEEVKKLVLEYLNELSEDYLASDEYINEGKIKGDLFRKSLSVEEKNALLALVDTGDNWDENINILKENLIKIETGQSRRKLYAFFEKDKDFIGLYNEIDSLKIKDETMEFISRFKKMIMEIAPNLYLHKYYNNIRSSCAWGDAEKAVEEFDLFIKKYPKLEDIHANYFIMYTVEHYRCSQIVHSKTMELIVGKYGVDYVVEHMKMRSERDKMTAIYLISKYALNNELNDKLEAMYVQMLDDFLPRISKDEKSTQKLKDYILCNSDEIDVSKTIKSKLEEIDDEWEWFLFGGKRLERMVEVVLTSKKSKIIEWMVSSFIREDEPLPQKFILDEVIKLNINTELFVEELLSYIEAYVHKFDIKGGVKYLEDAGINCLEYGRKFSDKLKKVILENAYGEEKIKREATLLIEYLGDKQKGVVQVAQKALKNLDESVVSEVVDKVESEIESYKGDKEVYAVEVLCHYLKDNEKLKQYYEIVKEPKSRDILAEVVGLDLEDLYKDEDGNFDIDIYLDSVYKKEKKFPMELDKLILPKRKDGKDAERAVEQLVISYKNSDELTINKEALLIAKSFTEESIKEFAKSVFIYWVNSSMNVKTKWQLLIPVIHGDYELVRELSKFIEELAANSRQKMAIYLIKALGLNGSKEAFVAIDKIGRRTKFKTLRLASSEAFEIAADQLGISKGELGDQLVGDMGFVDGYIPLDYGSQIMKLYIGKSLKFEIENESGKSYKSLPKGSKDDDEEKVEKAQKDFKQLKKDLKDMITLQTNRLEDALVEWRLWESKKWQELFLINPIMNVLGKALLWGIYKENKLVKAFAFDTEIFDMDYEDVELNDGEQIGIVHPLELTSDEIEAWKGVFEENEIKVLFDQLDREILEVEDEEALEFRPKDYPRKSPSTLIDRLRKKGWSMGSVRDGGSFNELYKELRTINIGIELTLLEHPYIGYYGHEADSDDGLVGTEKIEFYRIGTLERGSYVYDELEEHKGLRYKVSELPKRVVSELLFELKKALS
jgi:hypothetical protein